MVTIFASHDKEKAHDEMSKFAMGNVTKNISYTETVRNGEVMYIYTVEYHVSDRNGIYTPETDKNATESVLEGLQGVL